MELKKENDTLEMTLVIAEKGYPEAYHFLRNAYESAPQSYGAQTLYFLACLAGGSNLPTEALEWLRKAVIEKGWWYRSEVLEDDDLAALKNDATFLSLKAISDSRYADAVSRSKAVFSWKNKTAENLLLVIHGNTQNGETAQNQWRPVLEEKDQWQLETVQSGEPDGYGTYRWSYDEVSYLPVVHSMEKVQSKGYRKIICGGFSAGCDMLLRAVTLSPVRCDLLVLQSPWIPFFQEQERSLVDALRQKSIALRIFCGSDDEDCLPLAKQLYAATEEAGLDVKLVIHAKDRHQFPTKMYTLETLKLQR